MLNCGCIRIVVQLGADRMPVIDAETIASAAWQLWECQGGCSGAPEAMQVTNSSADVDLSQGVLQ